MKLLHEFTWPLVLGAITFGPMVVVIARDGWQRLIRPMFLPKNAIRLLAHDLIAQHGPRAAEMARIGEHRAWCYSDSYAQGVWRRVRRMVEREG